MKTLSMALVTTLALFTSSQAHAACDREVATAQKASVEALPANFTKIAKCDAKVAEQVFPKLMQKAGDLENLAALSMAAIEADVWNPVWTMPGKIKDYGVRDELAQAIGGTCGENPKVVAFLQGSYFGLRDIEFGQWDDAFLACDNEDLQSWMKSQVESPPAKLYDEKWNALAGIYVKRLGVDALPALGQAGIKAAEIGGPFEAILTAMDESVTPGLGEDMNPEHMKALEETLVGMAKQLPPDKARSIADRLSNSGNGPAAATLLPAIYPGYQLPDGSFNYGAVSIEAGECKGEKTAVLHSTMVNDPGQRYVMSGHADEGMRAFKPRLKKCKPEGDWPVVISGEPMLKKDELKAFQDEIAAQWTEKGYEVKVRDEDLVRMK